MVDQPARRFQPVGGPARTGVKNHQKGTPYHGGVDGSPDSRRQGRPQLRPPLVSPPLAGRLGDPGALNDHGVVPVHKLTANILIQSVRKIQAALAGQFDEKANCSFACLVDKAGLLPGKDAEPFIRRDKCFDAGAVEENRQVMEQIKVRPRGNRQGGFQFRRTRFSQPSAGFQKALVIQKLFGTDQIPPVPENLHVTVKTLLIADDPQAAEVGSPALSDLCNERRVGRNRYIVRQVAKRIRPGHEPNLDVNLSSFPKIAQVGKNVVLNQHSRGRRQISGQFLSGHVETGLIPLGELLYLIF